MVTRAKPGGARAKAPHQETLTDPHNAFFAFTFGQKQHAEALLCATLPPALTRRLDWTSLARRPGSFVDPKLRWLYNDLLFSVRALDTGEEVLVYVLIEHQSTPHPLMAFRVLRYATRVCEEHFKAHPQARRVPLVVPVVLYHGREPWNVARTVHELLDAPPNLVATVRKVTPQCGYLLLQLSHDDAELLANAALTALGRVALWAMTVAGQDDRVIEGLRRMSHLLGEMLAQPDGHAALGTLLRYLLATHEHIDRSKLRRVVAEALHPHAGEEVVTVYEQLVEEGKKKGRAEGRADLLLDQLAARFGPVAAEIRARVEKASATDLTAWGRRVLTAVTLEDVLGSSPVPRTERRAPRTRR